MDRTVITKRINRLACDIEKLKSTLAAIENTDIARYPENYNMLATDAALRSELIVCRLRRLVFQSTDTKKPEYLASAGVVQGIDIREENGVLKITLPCLLPKRKRKENTEFITDPLYFTLSRYSDGNPLKRYSHCVVCFSHIYCDDSKRYIRDYDNLELKQILDVIAAFLMEDDSGLLIDAYNTTETGKTDCTEISVMEKRRFSDWIKEHEKHLKNISDF